MRPDATEAEVRAAVEDTNGGSQVFQQALMQGNRTGQSRAVLSAVQDRHAAMARIEEQIVELAQLFEQLNTLIVEQDVKITQVEQKSEEVVENLDKGNEEIAVAIDTARKTRKKKWWCLGIIGMFYYRHRQPSLVLNGARANILTLVAILVIVAIVVAVVVLMNRPPAAPAPAPAKEENPKRDVLGDLHMNSARAVAFTGEAPVARVYGQSKIVVPNANFDPEAVPRASFAGTGPHILKLKGRRLTSRFILPDDWKDNDDST